MPLTPGNRLGPYEIQSPLGAGGMGEVYKAKDTRLDRTVALKVLPDEFFENEEKKARFEREAKLLAAVKHPGIAGVYAFEELEGRNLLAMELVEGETLADRVARGPLPLPQVLTLGAGIAAALDAAHRQGIVHRDLKPTNVMLTKSGIKVLDFGLAKMLKPDPLAGSLTSAPTTAKEVTREGVILGTLSYMAPEQLEGKAADARTDVFAFGSVLHEMATGKKAFSGASQASLIGAILHMEPAPISSVQPLSPPALDRLVRTCLAKDPDERWQSAGDVGRELKWIAEGSHVPDTAHPAPAPGMAARLGWLVAAALALTVIALSATLLSRRAPSAAVTRTSILPPEGAEFVSTWINAGPVEISPDGSRVVFTARKREGPNLLWVRALAESSARPLPGTEGAERPFWSPDGRFVGFFADGRLKKIDVSGGPVFTLAPVIESRGGTWNREGVILFTPDALGPICRVSADGGPVTPATVLGPKDVTHRYPRFLPDGRHFLYLSRESHAGAGPEPMIMVGSLDSKESKPVVHVASNALFASGDLLYVREAALVAQAFDLDRLAVRGEPVAIVPDILMDERFSRGVFSASENGVLVYQTGKGSTASVLRWLDRSGAVLGEVGEPAEFFNGGDPEISPDGRRATASILDLRTGIADIWMIDLADGTRSRFTTGPVDKFASAWSRDGRRIAYNIWTPGTSGYDIVVKPSDGAGAGEGLVSDPVELKSPCSFSPDGRFLLYQDRKEGRDQLWALPLAGDRKPVPVAVSPARQQMGQFSPNGRYVAFVSDESGRFEIYVTAFPGPGGRWQVSQNGGREPRWSRDGQELFFFAPDNRLVVAAVKTDGASFEVGAIRPLFQARSMGFIFRYDVAKDGKRFLVTSGLPQDLSPITLVTNWTSALREMK